MRRLILLTAVLAVACIFTVGNLRAAEVYSQDFEGYLLGASPFDEFYNGQTSGGTTAGSVVDIDGNKAYQISATLPGEGWVAYGFAMPNLDVTGNTSANMADYTLSWDISNISGAFATFDFWNIQATVCTYGTQGSGWAEGPVGYNYESPGISVSQGDGFVTASVNLADYLDAHSWQLWWNGSEGYDISSSPIFLEFRVAQNGAEGWPLDVIYAIDNIRLTCDKDILPHDPNVTPQNDDGSIGTPISSTQAEVTLGWNAGDDPNSATDYPVNPTILGHYVYFTTSDTDPNLTLLDYVSQVHNPDPNLTDPYNSYGPFTVTRGMTYEWMIEEALNDGTGTPYGAGDPNNIMGPVWSFGAIGAKPSILVGPENAIADSAGNVSFSVTADTVATTYRWFKEGTPDTQLSDGGIYSGTTTDTLVITGCTAADEGQYYCIAYNGDPLAGGIASDPSASAILWYPRLVHHYPFETVDASNVSPDVVSGLDAQLTNDGSTSTVPVLDTANPMVGSACLQLVNSVTADPNCQYAQLPAGIADYQDMTVSVWFYTDSEQSFTRLWDFGVPSGDYPSNYMCVTPRASWGPLRFMITTGGYSTEQVLDLGSSPSLGQWHHVAVTIGGDTGRLYFNGELVHWVINDSMTLDPIDLGATLGYIGKSLYAADPKFNGLVDDLQIYNYALSAAEIGQYYADIAQVSVCNYEIYDQWAYDTNSNCIIDLPDFAALAARWLEDDRVHPTP